MNRQQKRYEYRQSQKVIVNKTYTYTECMAMVDKAIQEKENQYCVTYALCLANSLSAQPLNFGHKRVCNVMELFFDTINEVTTGTRPVSEIIDEAKQVGVSVIDHNGEAIIALGKIVKYRRRKKRWLNQI